MKKYFAILVAIFISAANVVAALDNFSKDQISIVVQDESKPRIAFGIASLKKTLEAKGHFVSVQKTTNKSIGERIIVG